MKKTLYLFFIAAIAATSCKKDNKPGQQPGEGTEVQQPPAEEANSVPKKVTLTIDNVSVNYEFFYVENSKKLDKIVRGDGSVESYKYDSDLIKKIEFGEHDYKTFVYDNGRLSEELFYRDGQPVDKSTFTYVGTDKAKVDQYAFKNDEWKLENTVNLEFDSKGNLSKGNTVGMSVNMQYDDKNSPMVNITGWTRVEVVSGVPMGDNIGISDFTGRRNNPTKITISIDGIGSETIHYANEYNDSNHSKFPSKISATGAKAFSASFTYR